MKSASSVVLLLSLLISPGIALADKPGAGPDDARDAFLRQRKIVVSESKDFKGAPEWIQKGSGLFRGEQGNTFCGVGLSTDKVAARWQDRLLACRVLAMAEVQK